MKYLFLLLVLISCSTPVEEEPSIYPIIYDSWVVNSPDDADWQGMKAKADTTIYTQPGEIEVFITNIPRDPSFFMLSLRDTSKSTNYSEKWDAFWEIPTDPNGERPYEPQGHGFSGTPNDYTFEQELSYDCDPSTIIENAFFTLYIRDSKTDSTHQVFKVQVNGIKDAVNHIICL